MTTQASERDPVEKLAEEFVSLYRQGERPSLSAYVEKYPEFADEIRELFPALVLMEEFGSVGEEPTGPLPASAASPARVQQQLGDYRILREVGRGGMGIVYEAMQESLGRHVALKVLPLHGLIRPTHLERFRREARAVARLHHTNIVPVFGVGEHEGIHYYAMQFIQGQGLDSVLKELKALRGRDSETSDAGDRAVPGTTLTVTQGLLTGRFERREAATPEAAAGAASAQETPASAGSASSASDSSGSITRSQTELTSQPEADYFRGVARIGLQVADALEYAHRQGVLHRDIKPSNLLLDTQGTVWVTDFGLAKSEGLDELTSPGDIVGTLRYMAPERFQGRSEPRSDIYSLGMTLYELLTLRPAFDDSDRARLMARIAQEQPPRPRKLDPHIPRDLQTIVLKAIAKDLLDRYATAEHMAEDLRRFLADRPIHARAAGFIERSWRWCRRNPMVASLVASVVLLLVVISAISTTAAFWLHVERNKAQGAERDAERSADRAVENLRTSYLDQARAHRRSDQAERRAKSLEALSRAAAIRPGPDLRDEAIPAMCLIDLRVDRLWEGHPAGTAGLIFDSPFERYARSDADGNISIRRCEDDEELFQLPALDRGRRAAPLLFSPNGQYLAAGYHGDNVSSLRIWDLSARKAVLTWPNKLNDFAVDFSPDSRLVAAGQADGSVRLYDLPAEKELARLGKGPAPRSLRFHPKGRKLAVAASGRQALQVWDLDTRSVIRRFPYQDSATVRRVAWHPDGKLLAAAFCKEGDVDYSIDLWHFPTGTRRAALKGHQAEPTQVVFNRRGDLLASSGWDGRLRLWDPWTGKELLSTYGLGGILQFSRDGRRLAVLREGTKIGFWEVAAGRECLTLYGHRGDKGPKCLDLSADGRLMATAGGDGVRLWDLRAGREIAHLDINLTWYVLFHPDGASLITSGAYGIYRWPVRADPATVGRFQIGPPQPLYVKNPTRWASLSKDGRILAAYVGPEQAVVLDLEQPDEEVLLNGHRLLTFVCVSPDGRWVATGTRQGAGVKIWDARSGYVVHELPIEEGAGVVFSPDGKWLVTGTKNDYRFWAVGTWAEGRVIDRDRSSEPGVMSFNADGTILACMDSRYLIQWIDPQSGRKLGQLESLDPGSIGCLAFSGDGGKLAATFDNHRVQVWDLRLIRGQLSALGLDWNLQVPPPKPVSAPERLRIQVNLGELSSPPQLMLKQSVQFYTDRLRTLPGDVEALRQRASNHFYLGQDEQALADYTHALRLRPDLPHLYAARGQLHARLKQYDQAIADLTKALAMNPEQGAASNILAWLYLTAPPQLRAPDKALPLAQRATILEPDSWTFQVTLGAAYYRLGRYELAREVLEADDPERATAADLYFLAMAYHQLGQPEEAALYYERANRWIETAGPLAPQRLEDLAAIRAEAENLLGKDTPRPDSPSPR